MPKGVEERQQILETLCQLKYVPYIKLFFQRNIPQVKVNQTLAINHVALFRLSLQPVVTDYMD